MKKLLLKVLIGTACVFFSCNSAFSLNNTGFLTGNLGYCMPLGSFGDIYNGSISYNIAGEFEISPSIGLGISLGYIPWKFDAAVGNLSQLTAYSVVPILINARYHFPDIKGTIPFAGIDAGLCMTNLKFAYRTSMSNKKLGFAILGGALMPLGDAIYLNISASYNYINTGLPDTWLGLNAGISYAFTMKPPEEDE